jgi:hypothetical protein
MVLRLSASVFLSFGGLDRLWLRINRRDQLDHGFTSSTGRGVGGARRSGMPPAVVVEVVSPKYVPCGVDGLLPARKSRRTEPATGVACSNDDDAPDLFFRSVRPCADGRRKGR